MIFAEEIRPVNIASNTKLGNIFFSDRSRAEYCAGSIKYL